MGNKKATKLARSNTSNAANPGASVTAKTAAQSSILRSSFAPSRLNAPLFASIIQGLDTQKIRIHDTAGGRIRCEHSTTASTTINCLDWGYLESNTTDSQQAKLSKKRKRSSQLNGETSSADVVLAYGTSRSEIHIFSVTESKIVKTLKDGHSGGIRDFKFESGHGHRAYSLGGDGKVVQWDLKAQTATMNITLPNGPATALRPLESEVICASHSAFILDLKSKTWSNPYNVSTNNVHTVLATSDPPNEEMQFITIAEGDHFMNVFDKHSFVLNGSLRTDNEILSTDLWSSKGHSMGGEEELTGSGLQPKHTLLILNSDGIVELFPEPFNFDVDAVGTTSGSLKARMKQKSRKSSAQLRIVRPNQGTIQVPLINASFQNDQILVAWAEGGVNVIFDTLTWRDAETGKVLLDGSMEIVREKSGVGLGAVNMNGVKDMGRSYVNDSQAVVVSAIDADDTLMEEAEPEVIDISSAEEEEDDSENEEPPPRAAALQNDVGREDNDNERREDLVHSGDESMPDAETDENSREEPEAPSFGDLIRANAPESINVSDAFTDGNTQGLVRANSTSLRTLPSGMSLATVLTQSLRTNDTSLLETCLHTRDLSTVRSTIERLDSSFASDLLQRLAERLHSRPGRAGSLMVWIQWTLVAHGGYLAGQPEVMRKLKNLHKVVKERAGSLQSLLNLKGKLDMLEAQMNLRRHVLGKGKGKNVRNDDDEAVIYVEGQEAEDEDFDDEEDSDDSEALNSMEMKRVTGARDGQGPENEGDTDNVQPTTNGTPIDAEELSASDEDSMAGEDPSETDQDSEEELDDEDIDHASADDESSDGEASPSPTQARARLSNGIGSQ